MSKARTKTKTIRIIPPAPTETGLTRSQGTRVVTGSGDEIEGVTRIELTAQVNDLWRAHLWVNPEVVELSGVLATWEPSPRPSWWRRLFFNSAKILVQASKLGSVHREHR
jgi:hypothetical protein